MDDISNTIKNIYNKKGYLDKYGGSLFITILTLFIFFIIYSYFSVINNIKPLKENWNNERCTPLVIPFAGLINKDPSMTAFEYTGKNFTGCVNNILLTISNEFLKPIYYVISLIQNLAKDLTSSVQQIRKKVLDIVSKLQKIDNEIMTRIFNFLLPIRYIFIKLNDTFNKVQGTLVTSIYSVLSGYLALQSFLGAFTELMKGALIAISAVVVPLLLFFFTAPLAIPGLAAYAIIAAFLIKILNGLENIVSMTSTSKQSAKRCFDADTPITLSDGKKIPISKININDKLQDGSYVTAKLKLSSEDITMYNYKNIIVSGTHKAIINNIHIEISELHEAKKINNYRKPFIYCLNTSNKVLKIKDILFTDWDEINGKIMDTIKTKYGEKLSIHFSEKNIHSIFDGGFERKTNIELIDGSSIHISKIDVGNILRSGEKIVGVVEISTHGMYVNRYYIDGCNKTSNQTFKSDKSEDSEEVYKSCYIIGGPNNQICDQDLGHFSTMDIKCFTQINNSRKPDKLYHILTDSGKIIINGVMFYDYNGCLDVIIE